MTNHKDNSLRKIHCTMSLIFYFWQRHAPRAIFIGYDSTTHTLSPPGIAEALLISVQTDSIRIRVPAPGLLCSASVTYHQLDRYERERYAAIWGAMTYERSG